MAEGFDFAWARPGGAAIVAAGRSFVVRYLYPGGGKGTTAAEQQDYIAHGLKRAFVYEEDGQELLGGFAAGVRVAKAADAQRAAVGLPGTTPIYFAGDFNAQGAQLAACVAAIDGAVSVLGHDRVGGYGGLAFIDAIAGHCKYGWQTYAWSGGKVSSNANLYQYLNGQTVNGGAVDFCRNLTADFGAIDGTLSPSAPASSGGAAVGSNTSGQPTTAVQQALNKFGYNLAVDGIYGPATTAAVVDFQHKHGLTADGIVGPITWAALGGGPVSKPGALAVDGIWGPLTTEDLQRALGVTADGIIGPQTITALQHHLGITADGINGPQTHRALQAHLGVAQDGIWGPQTAKALQQRLNAGTF